MLGIGPETVLATMKRKPDPMRGYKPMVFRPDSKLTPYQRARVEDQRRDLWRHGVRKQPLLDRMALEFGYVVCLLQDQKDDDQGSASDAE